MEAQEEQNLPAAGARRSVHHHSIPYDAARWAKPGQDLEKAKAHYQKC
jgi:hypothetical protein